MQSSQVANFLLKKKAVVATQCLPGNGGYRLDESYVIVRTPCHCPTGPETNGTVQLDSVRCIVRPVLFGNNNMWC